MINKAKAFFLNVGVFYHCAAYFFGQRVWASAYSLDREQEKLAKCYPKHFFVRDRSEISSIFTAYGSFDASTIPSQEF